MEFGKLHSAAELAVSSAAEQVIHYRKPRLFVQDKQTGLRFLVDSGADVSLIPAKSGDKKQAELKLYAANGTKIDTYGTKLLEIDLGLRRDFTFPFKIAKIDKGILGADFRNKFNLLIHYNGLRRMIIKGSKFLGHTISQEGILPDQDKVRAIQNMQIPKNKQELQRILGTVTYLAKFIPDLSSNTSNMRNLLKKDIIWNWNIAADQELNFIKTLLTSPPVLRHFDPNEPLELFADASKDGLGAILMQKEKPLSYASASLTSPQKHYSQIEKELLALYFGCKRHTRPADPLYIKDRVWFRKDKRWIPGQLENQANEPRSFYVKDQKGNEYRKNSIHIREDKRSETTHTDWEKPEQADLQDLEESPSQPTSSRQLSSPGSPENVTTTGPPESSEEDKEKTAVITPFGLFEFNVMSFGLRNAPATFQRFINEVLFGLDFVFPYIDDILIASTNKEEHETHLDMIFERLSKHGLRNNANKSKFGVQEVEFLGHLITKEGSRPLLSKTKAVQEYKLPETIQDLRTFLELPLSLSTDASNWAVGAVLQQYEENGWEPIAFYSKKLNDTQKSYSTYDRELLAIYLSVKNFKHMLEGRDFKIYTDHKPLKYAFLQRNEKASPRQLRHLQYIFQVTTNIEHVDGRSNIVADTLSRIEEVSMIDYNEIALKQINDTELFSLKQKTNLKFQYTLPSGKVLWCETSTNNIRPYIPKDFRKRIFLQIHGALHPGIRSSVKQMKTKFLWTNIKKDVQEWARICVACQRNKITRHTKSKIGCFPENRNRFCVAHIDCIGPLPPSNGHIYCLTCIDRFTGWPEVIPLKNIKADTLAQAFYEHWILRFGMPSTIITDCAKQFSSTVFQNLAFLCRIKIQHTTPYHPQSNSKIERFHRTIKTAIRAHNSLRWTDTLPTVLLGFRAALREYMDFSAAEMVYGVNIKLPGEFFENSKITTPSNTFVDDLRRFFRDLKPKVSSQTSSRAIFIHKDMNTCSHVFLRIDRVEKSLEPPYQGPYLILERHDKYFVLDINGRNALISIDRLKPAYLPSADCNTDTVKSTPFLPNDAGDAGTPRSGRTIRRPVRFMDCV
ncbi:hypothetical protein LAZ67_1005925, partial [Cordylochernes scorpioides]